MHACSKSLRTKLNSWKATQNIIDRIMKLVLVFTLLISAATSNILQCTYSVRDVWLTKQVYTCSGTFTLLSDNPTLTEVSGTHVSTRNNNDVKAIYIENQEVRFFPRDIEKYFPNVEVISIINGGIGVISRSAFGAYAALTQLQLDNNNIRLLGDDLFAANSRLKSISFSNNPISHVAYNVFDSLSSLSALDMRNTACFNEAQTSRLQVVFMLVRLATTCPSTTAMAAEDVLEEVNTRIDERMAPWELRFTDLETKVIANDVKLTYIELRLEETIRILNIVVDYINGSH